MLHRFRSLRGVIRCHPVFFSPAFDASCFPEALPAFHPPLRRMLFYLYASAPLKPPIKKPASGISFPDRPVTFNK